MRKRLFLGFLLLLILLSFSACVRQAKALTLTPWDDESLPFEIALPEGWTLKEDPEKGAPHYFIQTAEYNGKAEDFRVHLYFSRNESGSLEGNMAESSTRLETWMAELISDDYEIYSKNDFRVNKNPALALDFAKPLDESYMVGRVVIVTHPTHTIGFVAMASEAEWNVNVRTFDKIVSGFKIKPELGEE